MNHTVLLPSGARLTMLPPGTSEGAETNPECFRIVRGRRGSKVQMYGREFVRPRNVRGSAFNVQLSFKNSTVQLPSGKLFTLRGGK